MSLCFFRIDPSLSIGLPAGPVARELARARALFSDPERILVALPVGGDPFDSGSLERLVALSRCLDELGEADGEDVTWKLLSPATSSDIVLLNGALVSRPLFSSGKADPKGLRERIASSPLLTLFFLAENGKAWNLYIETSLEGEALLGRLEKARAFFPEIRVAGMPYYIALQSRILNREFLPLLFLAALFLFFAEWVLLGDFGTALGLWAFSLAPTLLLMSLFPLTDTPLTVALVLAPIITLAISTSYTTHLYHGWAVSGRDPLRALRDRGDIIGLDALTTALGFGSLVLSPIPQLKTLGLFTATGVVISFLTAELGLGSFLAVIRSSSRAEIRYATGASTLPPASGRKRVFLFLVWVSAVVFFGVEIRSLKSGKADTDFFRPHSQAGKELSYFVSEQRGFDEIHLVLDTETEYGLVDLAVFRSLQGIEERMIAEAGVGTVYGYTDLVGETLARWQGLPGLVEPVSSEEIGESLEILSSFDAGLMARGLTNADWSAARIRITVRPGIVRMDLLTRLRKIVNEADLPGKVLFSGAFVENAEVERVFLAGQIEGLGAFSILLLLILWAYFRSFPRAVLTAAAPATGLLASLAVMSMLGWHLSQVNSMALAAIAGIGVDDALMMVAKGNSRETRSAIKETTILISLALSVLFFSSSYMIVQTVLVAVVGMIASTLVALFILPAFAPRPEGTKGDHA